MTNVIAACCVLIAADTDTSCVFLLHGDGESAWGSTASLVQSIHNHGAQAAEGKFGRAVRLNGQTAYVDGGQFLHQGYSFPQQTISVWIRPERDGKLEGIVGSQEKPGQSSWRWSLVRHTDGTVAFQIYDNANAKSPKREARSRAKAPVDAWTHVAAVIDTREGTAKLYVNGEADGTDDVRSNHPYGTLIIGHSLGGPFQGSVDELAIFERAFSPEDIAALASRSAPLPAPGPTEWTGFWLRPRGDTPFMGFWHSVLPESSWILRVTEYAYYDSELRRNISARNVAWTIDPNHKSAEFRWEASDDLKREVGLDFWGEYKAHGDHLDFTITGKNVGTEVWDRTPLSLVCLISGGAPPFVDYEAHRTFVRRGQGFVTMNEIVNGEFASHRMCGVSVSRDGDQTVSRLAAKVSADGKCVLGLAVDRAGSLSFNFQKRTSCIHSNPSWPLLKPGEQATARGRVYLFEGTLDDLWQRYVKDFESEE